MAVSFGTPRGGVGGQSVANGAGEIHLGGDRLVEGVTDNGGERLKGQGRQGPGRTGGGQGVGGSVGAARLTVEWKVMSGLRVVVDQAFQCQADLAGGERCAGE